MATGYDSGRNPVQAGYWMEPRAGAGLVSTAHDLALFAQAHLGIPFPGQEPLFSPEALRIMHQEDDPRAPNFGKYKMGWGIVGDGRYSSLISNGAILGSAASILLLPGEQIAIVCVTNISTRKPDGVVVQIADALLPGFAEGWLSRVALLEEEPPSEISIEELAGAWEGRLVTYEGEIPVSMTWDVCGHVFVEVDGQLRGVVNDLSLNGNHVRGQTLGRIATEDGALHNHDLELDLSYESGKLFGTITAVTTDAKPWFGLPYYVELERKSASS